MLFCFCISRLQYVLFSFFLTNCVAHYQRYWADSARQEAELYVRPADRYSSSNGDAGTPLHIAHTRTRRHRRSLGSGMELASITP